MNPPPPPPPPRCLIVDTDVGLDDLVALSILRVWQAHLRLDESGCSGPVQDPHGRRRRRRHRHVLSTTTTSFRLSGVILTSGISDATPENADLIRRILPPGTPVYVGGRRRIGRDDGGGKDGEDVQNEGRPAWWTRTADRARSFLSSLPPPSPPSKPDAMTLENGLDVADLACAESFAAMNMDDPNVDFLCLAPLSTIAGALRLRAAAGHIRDNDDEPHNDDDDGDGGEKRRRGGRSTCGTTRARHPRATFYVMGGIRSDSRRTKRGESTSPFGYVDPLLCEGDASGATSGAAAGAAAGRRGARDDPFGEFNFALDVESARRVLLSSDGVRDARLMTVEACTLVPDRDAIERRRSSLEACFRVSSGNDDGIDDGEASHDGDAARRELRSARAILRGLFLEFGTVETQWDSIAAAVYCNVLGASRGSRSGRGEYDDDKLPPRDDIDDNDVESEAGITRIDVRRIRISNSGELSFPGCRSSMDFDDKDKAEGQRGAVCDTNVEDRNDGDDNLNICHQIYPDFTLDDEIEFFGYMFFLLHSNLTDTLQSQWLCNS